MSVGEHCRREVVTATAEDPVRNAVHLMRKYHIGDVIVVEERENRRIPIGIVTDRDLLMEVLDRGADPDVLVLGDVMSESVLALGDTESLDSGVRRMSAEGVRRAPVVDALGGLVGVLSMDDVLVRIAEELGDLSGLLGQERAREREVRPGTDCR